MIEQILKFPDQSASFAYGVEFGRLLEKIERNDDPIQNNGFPVRIENKKLLIDACKKYGYIPTFGAEYFNEWVEFMGMRKTTSNN